MRNPSKAILFSLLIAIPAPLVLAILLSFTPEPLRLIAAGQLVEALGSNRGIAAYIISLIVFGIAGFLAIALSVKKPAEKQQNNILQDSYLFLQHYLDTYIFYHQTSYVV